MCERSPFPPVFGCISEIGKCVLSMEHEQGYGNICSIGKNQKDYINEGDIGWARVRGGGDSLSYRRGCTALTL